MSDEERMLMLLSDEEIALMLQVEAAFELPRGCEDWHGRMERGRLLMHRDLIGEAKARSRRVRRRSLELAWESNEVVSAGRTEKQRLRDAVRRARRKLKRLAACA